MMPNESGSSNHHNNSKCCSLNGLRTVRRKRVTVLLLRHGERADEAFRKNMSLSERKRYALQPKSIRPPVENTIDPQLTAAGYEQARVAWRTILSAIAHQRQQQHPDCHHTVSNIRQEQQLTTNSRRVTVVCSPLRRCIGTALMLSSSTLDPSVETFASTTHSTERNNPASVFNIDWWSLYPHWRQEPTNASRPLPLFNESPATRSVLPIPILVMNGLCSCAKAIARFGGNVQVAIESGHDIPCAVVVRADSSGASHAPDDSNRVNIHFNTEIHKLIEDAQNHSGPHLSSSTLVQFLGFQQYRKRGSNARGLLLHTHLSSAVTATERRPCSSNDTPIRDIDGRLPVTESHAHHPIYNVSRNNGSDDVPFANESGYSTPERQMHPHISSTIVCLPNKDRIGDPEQRNQAVAVTTPPRRRLDDADNIQENTAEDTNDDATFLGALNRAVQMSVEAASNDDDDDDGNDIYLVVVTHREGIRSLIEHCKVNDIRERNCMDPSLQRIVKTPYCCIGTFTATVNCSEVNPGPGGYNNIKYMFHNVTNFEDFTTAHLPGD
jgi:hypothetical protein